MSIVKSFAVGNGDMFYIQHNSDNFTIIDGNLTADTATERINELKQVSRSKGITRVISTHPDQYHFGGIYLLDTEIPQIIVIGEAPSRHLNHYTGHKKFTQNRAGDITMELVGNKVHFCVSNPNYKKGEALTDEGANTFDNYVGSIKVETEYTLDEVAA